VEEGRPRVVRPARLPGALRVLAGFGEAVFFRGRDDVALDVRLLTGAFRAAAAGRGGAGVSTSGASASATDSRTRPTAAAAALRPAAACRTAAARSSLSYMSPTVAAVRVVHSLTAGRSAEPLHGHSATSAHGGRPRTLQRHYHVD
jgi:hypothetical protein